MTKIYKDIERNHVIVEGRKEALKKFINSTTVINGKRVKHKLKHAYSPNSEDALTWSCFDALRNYKPKNLVDALNELLEDSFENNKPFDFKQEKNIIVEIGKEYVAPTLRDANSNKEKTEVDASIETDDKLIFIEAKLYSSISLPDEDKILLDEGQPRNQIANKLRVGLDYARRNHKQFYFIFLDIAPLDKISQMRSKSPGKSICEASQGGSNFGDKWKSAKWFKYYKDFRNSIKPLREDLEGVIGKEADIRQMQQNMGWLTWASLFKITLRAAVK